MAHYSFINDENIVVEVITGKDENDLETLPEGFASWEEYYETKRDGLTCKRTSYNTQAGEHLNGGTAFRGNYAGIGFTYDPDNDVFYAQSPHSSWVLNETSWIWEAPLPRPDPQTDYVWDEDVYQADTSDPKTQGWVLINES